MTIIRILVVGLIAFHSDDDDLTILVRDSQTPYHTFSQQCVEPHIPVLWWGDGTKCAGDCDTKDPDVKYFYRCDQTQKPRPLKKSKHYWLLNREELLLDGTMLPQQAPHSFKRICKMTDIKGWPLQARKISKYWLPKSAQQVSSGIAARMHFGERASRLQACHVARTEDETKLAYFSLLKGKKPVKELGHLADISLVTIKLKGKVDPVRVTATTFDSAGKATRSVDLTPKECDGGKPLGDLCLSLILSNQPPLVRDPDRVTAHHFERFYHFSKREPAIQKRPIVRADTSMETSDEVEAACERVLDQQTYTLLQELKKAWDLKDKAEDDPAIVSLNNRPLCPELGY